MTDLRLIDPTDAGAAARLAALHRAAFDRPWDAAAIAVLLSQPGVFALSTPGGFILCRTVVDEAEILTLAVNPDARRRGVGGRLCEAAAAMAARAGALRLFLEVAEDNTPARAVYARLGFAVEGRRRGYYARDPAPPVDALLLVLNLRDRLPTA